MFCDQHRMSETAEIIRLRATIGPARADVETSKPSAARTQRVGKWRCLPITITKMYFYSLLLNGSGIAMHQQHFSIVCRAEAVLSMRATSTAHSADDVRQAHLYLVMNAGVVSTRPSTGCRFRHPNQAKNIINK